MAILSGLNIIDYQNLFFVPTKVVLYGQELCGSEFVPIIKFNRPIAFPLGLLSNKIRWHWKTDDHYACQNLKECFLHCYHVVFYPWKKPFFFDVFVKYSFLNLGQQKTILKECPPRPFAQSIYPRKIPLRCIGLWWNPWGFFVCNSTGSGWFTLSWKQKTSWTWVTAIAFSIRLAFWFFQRKRYSPALRYCFRCPKG